jgi:hypothetical protein
MGRPRSPGTIFDGDSWYWRVSLTQQCAPQCWDRRHSRRRAKELREICQQQQWCRLGVVPAGIAQILRRRFLNVKASACPLTLWPWNRNPCSPLIEEMTILSACVTERPVEQRPFRNAINISGSTQCKQEGLSLFPVVRQFASQLPVLCFTRLRVSKYISLNCVGVCPSCSVYPCYTSSRLQVRLCNKWVGREEQVTLFISTLLILWLVSWIRTHFLLVKSKKKAMCPL